MNDKALTTKNSASYPSKIKEISEWAKIAKNAGMLPNNMNAYQAMAIIATGMEMGLQPFQSLRMMSFIRGRLVMAVQLQLALAREKCGVKLVEVKDGDDFCEVTLARGDEKVTTKFTVEDAKKAGLINPDPKKYRESNWGKYQRQMLRWRAIGDALRLIAPDLVFGLLSPEEAETLPPANEEVIDVEPESGTEVTEKQRKFLFAKMKEAGLSKEQMKELYELIMTDADDKKTRASHAIDAFDAWVEIYNYLSAILDIEKMQEFFRWCGINYEAEEIKKLAKEIREKAEEFLGNKTDAEEINDEVIL